MHLPGQAKPAPLELTARHLGKKALQAWIGASKDRSDPEFLGEVIVGWSASVVDAADSPVPFSPTALALLLNEHAGANHAIYNAYLDELTQGRAKNS